MVKKGTWVSLRATILQAGHRASGIPDDTAATPLIMWVKGTLQHDCNIGDAAHVTTITGRSEEGILEEVQPTTHVDYGDFVPELLSIGAVARGVLRRSLGEGGMA